MRTCPTCQRRYIDSQTVCPMDECALGPGDGAQPPGLGKELGSYRLISLLGRGGMGSIYIGAHTRLNRYVAIKVLRRELDKKKENISRFFDEARTVNRIKHPNIVESIDLIEDVVDGAYCVMELLQGVDLKTRLERGPLEIESAVQIGAQIADGLSAVHGLGVVHRDLKPENVMLIKRGGREDFVKLIDFGVAQISDEGATGIPFGTAAYMAPEQAAGERVDGRADVYSLGVMLFEMTTGQHPFPSQSDNEYLLRHADDPPPPPSALRRMPKALEALILRCLAKQPDDRFPSAAAVAVALRAIDLDEGAPKSGAWKWLVAALVLGGLAAAAVFVVVPRLTAGETTDAQATATAAATAPATAPPPAEPVRPATVEVEFTSSPRGATVTREGETVPLGKTPFTATLARSDKDSKVTFELAGHEPVEVALPLAADGTVTAELARVPAVVSKQPPAPARPKQPADSKSKPKQVQREGVMDPFAN